MTEGVWKWLEVAERGLRVTGRGWELLEVPMKDVGLWAAAIHFSDKPISQDLVPISPVGVLLPCKALLLLASIAPLFLLLLLGLLDQYWCYSICAIASMLLPSSSCSTQLKADAKMPSTLYINQNGEFNTKNRTQRCQNPGPEYG